MDATPITQSLAQIRTSFRLVGVGSPNQRRLLRDLLVAHHDLGYRERIVLAETFVEQGRFEGTCYRAANWTCLGHSRGRGRNDRYNRKAEPD